MAWRKWFVRLLVFTVVGSCGGGVFLYQRFTNPARRSRASVGQAQDAFRRSRGHGRFGAAAHSGRHRRQRIASVAQNRSRQKRNPPRSHRLFYHDKEKVLGGELVLRKVELDRPRLHVQRNKDGSWNLQGIGGKLQPGLPLPIVVVHQGTLEFEDRGPSGTGKIIELTDVDLRLVNDPLDMVTIEGSAMSEFTGKLRISGQWQRHTQERELTLKAQQISLAGHRFGPAGKALSGRHS